LCWFFFLVFLNGFFVAAEFAMVKIRTSRIEQMVAQGHRRAPYAQKLVSNLDAYLSACQLGITLSSLGLGWIGEPAIARLIEPPLASLGVPPVAVHTIAFVLAFGLITVLHIVLGELAPKSLAIQKSEGTVLNVALPMIAFHRIMYPFIWLLNGAANALLRLFGVRPPTDAEAAHTQDEIRMLLNQSHESGLIDQSEKVLFDNMFDFAERKAREIMVPRVDMIALDIDERMDVILQVIEQEQLTRYPVIRGDKDTVVGFVNLKDIYYHARRNEPFTLDALLRRPMFLSESTEISAALKQMQKHRTQIAIVLDEYGGTAGLLTIEDILEELVGEIQDEFDNELPPVIQLPDGYSVEGRHLLSDLEELLGVELVHEDVDTLSGWIYFLLGRNPELGDRLEYAGYELLVETMGAYRIERVRISRLTPNESHPSPVDSTKTV